MKSLVITSACALFLLAGCPETQRHLEGDADLDDAELGDADLELDGALEDADPVEDADLVGDADEIVSPDGDGDVDSDSDGDGDEDEEHPLPLSCLEILRADPSSPSGVYEVMAPDGPINVFCEMEFSGGGWTALINPDLPGLEPKHRWLGVSADIIEGEGGCGGEVTHDVFEGWHRYTAYLCGSDSIALNLAFESMPEIRDVMFTSTIQGQDSHVVQINGLDIEPDVSSTGEAPCHFFNSESLLTNPGVNECWSTSIDADPHVAIDVVRSPTLDMGLLSGPSGSPSWDYGTGSNITRLFVR